MNDLLEHSETLRLIRLAQQGDRQAQDQLVECNVALVKSIVRKFLGRGVEYDDLFQIGCLGLVKSIRNFDTGYDVRFSTYAVPMIAGEIKRFLRDDGMVKVSRSLKEAAARAAQAQEQLSRTLGREATVQEIAQAAGMSCEDLVQALEASKACLSLQEPVFEDEGAQLLDRISLQDNPAEHLIDRLLLKELLGMLEPRERQIVVLRYFQDKTQSEIARLLGVSQVQVSRLENKIIRKMKEAAGE
jgi:RNA polymerase sporulation-specific sigma factor